MRKYLVLIFMTAATAASAQQLSMSDRLELRDNCKKDIKELCPGVKPGDGKLMACVQDNKDKLSKGCSDTITKLMAKKEN